MKTFKLLLSGGDRRSLGRAPIVARRIKTTKDLDQLFRLIYSSDRTVAMRAIDTLEKATRSHNDYLRSHGNELVTFARSTANRDQVAYSTTATAYWLEPATISKSICAS